MTKQYTYPHWRTNVIDKSIYEALNRERLPLLVPIFFMRAQQGPVGVPVWTDSYSTATNTFGEGTFDETTEYFSREALYLKQLYSRQGAFITRMASADADYGSLVLELRVKKTQVIQYKKDANGQFILDENTLEKIPETDDTTGEIVKEPGYELKWQTRAMKLNDNHPETITNLQPTTYGTGDNEYTVYPILALKASSVGAYSSDIGIKFFFDVDSVDETLINNIGSISYTFGVVKKTYGQDTVSAVQSFFGNQFEQVVAKPNQQDTRVAHNVSFDDIMNNEYNGILPFTIHLYSDNVKKIGELMLTVEDDETLTDPYMVNLADAYNIDGNPYSHIVISQEDDSIFLNDSRIMYLTGGSDGSIDDASIEELTRQYLQDLVYPEILDQARYPFTHIFDTGVSFQTKKSFLQFMGKHDACKVILATQDANMGRMNTKAEDLSAGASLYAECLLQPESIIKGTECFRAEIYQQCGYLADSSYRGIVPTTYDIMMKKSRWMSSTSVTGQPAGLPNSQISVFKEWNWTPCDADHKQRSWDSGLNYFQHYDMTGIHWPAMRTVYRYDTSVLMNATFSDVIVFAKHLARYNWSRYVGMELPFTMLATRATSSLTNDLSAMINGMYNFSVEFSQSEEEAKIGYISHATVKIWGNPQQRVWEIDFECYRNGYDSSSTTE